MVVLEILVILSLLLVGVLALRAFGFTGWPILPVGFLAGISLFVLTGYLFSVLGIPYVPQSALAFNLIMVGGFWLDKSLKDKRLLFSPLLVGSTIATVTVLVIFFFEANLFKYHFDSLRYLITSHLLYTNNLDSISMNLTTKRFSSVSIIHSLSGISGGYYLKSLTPLISLSLLGALWWLIQEFIRDKLSTRKSLVILFLSVLVLATSHTYLWHSFYINGHLLTGAFILLASGVGWLITTNKLPLQHKPYSVVISLSLIGVVLTRPEGFLYAIAILAPFIFTPKIPLGTKKLLLLSLGISMFLQQAFVYKTFMTLGRTSSSPVLYLSIIILSIAIAYNYYPKILSWISMSKFWLLEASIWSTLLFFYIGNPSHLHSSLKTTYHNALVPDGNWGSLVTMLTALGVFVLLFKRLRDQVFIRFVVMSYIPIVYIVAYLRGNPYRIAAADSLNRMIMHIIPLVLFYIVVMLSLGSWRPYIGKIKKKLTSRRDTTS